MRLGDVMIILPKNYDEIYPCINSTGATSKIFVSPDYNCAYKVYRSEFNYDEGKFKQFLKLNNSNCLSPKDILSIEGSNCLAGYMMLFDNGVSLSRVKDEELEKLIKASLEIKYTLKDLSDHHFLIMDPNVDNIIFSNSYKFVDTYSFSLRKSISSATLQVMNTKKVNEMVLCGLIGQSYKKIIRVYLNLIRSKYLDYFFKLNNQDDNYIYDVLSIIREATKEEILERAKTKVITQKKY